MIFIKKPEIMTSTDDISKDIAFLDIAGNSIFKGNEIIADIWKLLPASSNELTFLLSSQYEADVIELENTVQKGIGLLISYDLITAL
jgi:hypothetical protein